jgi:hypothetical protein
MTVESPAREAGNSSLHGEPIELRFSGFFVVGEDGRFSQRDTFFFAPPAGGRDDDN